MSTKFLALLRRFEQAVEQRAFKGANDPESWDEIEQEYTEAKEALVSSVNHLYAAYKERIN